MRSFRKKRCLSLSSIVSKGENMVEFVVSMGSYRLFSWETVAIRGLLWSPTESGNSKNDSNVVFYEIRQNIMLK